MSDLFSGIRQIGPAYPVKPLLPPQKDRKPGERHKDNRRKPEAEERHDDDHNDDQNDDHKPTIDEHV